MEQFKEAWGRRDMAGCWRLARVMAGTKVQEVHSANSSKTIIEGVGGVHG